MMRSSISSEKGGSESILKIGQVDQSSTFQDRVNILGDFAPCG